jgi:hypothetical protein
VALSVSPLAHIAKKHIKTDESLQKWHVAHQAAKGREEETNFCANATPLSSKSAHDNNRSPMRRSPSVAASHRARFVSDVTRSSRARRLCMSRVSRVQNSALPVPPTAERCPSNDDVNRSVAPTLDPDQTHLWTALFLFSGAAAVAVHPVMLVPMFYCLYAGEEHEGKRERQHREMCAATKSRSQQ